MALAPIGDIECPQSDSNRDCLSTGKPLRPPAVALATFCNMAPPLPIRGSARDLFLQARWYKGPKIPKAIIVFQVKAPPPP